MDTLAIAGIMGDVLDVGDLSEDENFFAVGGNSLLALTVVSEMESRLGVTISLLDFIRHPTARGISRLIGERRPEQQLSTLLGGHHDSTLNQNPPDPNQEPAK